MGRLDDHSLPFVPILLLTGAGDSCVALVCCLLVETGVGRKMILCLDRKLVCSASQLVRNCAIFGRLKLGSKGGVHHWGCTGVLSANLSFCAHFIDIYLFFKPLIVPTSFTTTSL